MKVRRALLAAVTALGMLGVPVAAVAQAPEACTDTANVSWETDWDTVTVEAAIVHVPGCVDGDEVGLQLLTDDGDLPTEPLVGTVDDERVRFDLSGFDVRIEPVIGVRVLLYGETLVEIVGIVVEQRFFAQNGNEQRGLLRTTTLEVPLGGTYEVPGAPTRYDVVSCSDMGWTAPVDLVGQGAGTFTATEAGRHVVCYQQRPGTPGGPPDVEDPVVGDDTDVLGDQVTRPAPTTGGGPLASTGANVAMLGLLGLLLIAAGRRVVAGRRS